MNKSSLVFAWLLTVAWWVQQEANASTSPTLDIHTILNYRITTPTEIKWIVQWNLTVAKFAELTQQIIGNCKIKEAKVVKTRHWIETSEDFDCRDSNWDGKNLWYWYVSMEQIPAREIEYNWVTHVCYKTFFSIAKILQRGIYIWEWTWSVIKTTEWNTLKDWNWKIILDTQCSN